jgi:hypothetical protein
MSAPATAAPQTKTFEFKGKAETFEVPANVCQITVGGHGGDGTGPAPQAVESGAPGESRRFANGGTAGAGGFNGGGDGGIGTDPEENPEGGGGSGGGSRLGPAGPTSRPACAKVTAW